ncbi:MAG: hypothetical protein MHM6MM_000875 [Cercozoa sp. M6MM]
MTCLPLSSARDNARVLGRFDDAWMYADMFDDVSIYHTAQETPVRSEEFKTSRMQDDLTEHAEQTTSTTTSAYLSSAAFYGGTGSRASFGVKNTVFARPIAKHRKNDDADGWQSGEENDVRF